MVNYFLGKLSPDAEQQFEKLFFANDQLFDCFLAVKEELIDNYLFENLSVEDRLLFEENFLLSPSHRTQVALARSLMNLEPSRPE